MSVEPTLERIFGECDEEVSRLGTAAVVSMNALVIRKNIPRPAVIEDSTDFFEITFHGGDADAPVVMRSEQAPDSFVVLTGESRYYNAQRSGAEELPVVIVTEEILDRVRPEAERRLRSYALDAYEEALAYSRLICEYGLTTDELAAALGKSRSAVTNAVRLLDLPEALIVLLRARRLTAGHCRALLALEDKTRTLSLAQKIAGRNLSVREVENAVKSANRQFEAQHETTAASPVVVEEVTDYSVLEQRVSARLGRRLKIQEGKSGSFLSVVFSGDEDAVRLLRLLCGEDTEDAEDDPSEETYSKTLEERAAAGVGRPLTIRKGKRRNVLSLGFTDDEDLKRVLRLLCGESSD